MCKVPQCWCCKENSTLTFKRELCGLAVICCLARSACMNAKEKIMGWAEAQKKKKSQFNPWMHRVQTETAFLLSTLNRSQTAVIELIDSNRGFTQSAQFYRSGWQVCNATDMPWKEQARDAHKAALWSLGHWSELNIWSIVVRPVIISRETALEIATTSP